jgi:hypothetical protein
MHTRTCENSAATSNLLTGCGAYACQAIEQTIGNPRSLSSFHCTASAYDKVRSWYEDAEAGATGDISWSVWSGEEEKRFWRRMA